MPRFVAVAAKGEVEVWPSGMDTCPTAQVWDGYRGEPYEVFFDESFHKFFGLNDPEGNFCYGAVGIPVSQLNSFNSQMTSLLQEYQTALPARTRPEFKASELLRLDQGIQTHFLGRIAVIILSVGGFVSGYYVPVAGIVLERVRVDLMNKRRAVPKKHEKFFKIAQQHLVANLTGPNQADLVIRMLQAPSSAMTHFLGIFDTSFTIVYDPRQKQEDEIVRAAMANYLDMASRVTMDDDTPNATYLGMDISRKSEDSFGLQAADLMAGLYRNFFRQNKELVEYQAGLKLITPTSREEAIQLVSLGGNVMKFGALVPIHPNLNAALAVPNATNPLSYFTHLFAAGVLGGMTSTGQYRGIEVYNGIAFDMND